MLVDDYGIDHLFFNDDIFTLDKRWVYRLLETLGTLQTPVAWECATRVDLVDRDLLKAMADAGCVGVQFGVESGAQEILDSVKSVSKQQAMAAVDAAAVVGIRPLCSFMVPFPEDTPETLQETGDFMGVLKDLGSDIVLSYTAPYPGTYFYSHADELGLRILTDCWDEFDAKHVVMETRSLSAEQIRTAVEGIAERLRMSWNTDWRGSASAELSQEGWIR